jgi:predicted DNA-binding protein (MmcQ/YjbR family)
MAHHDQLDSPQGRRLLAAVRAACAALPNVVEQIDGFGHTTFRVGKKSFVIAGMGEDGTSISIKADRANQALLVSRGPYYRTPYIGQHGWVSVDAPLDQNWDEIRGLIEDAYRLAAPKRVAGLREPQLPDGRPPNEMM